jgi:hypothetical protein
VRPEVGAEKGHADDEEEEEDEEEGSEEVGDGSVKVG